jgi:hypothetical protein
MLQSLINTIACLGRVPLAQMTKDPGFWVNFEDSTCISPLSSQMAAPHMVALLPSKVESSTFKLPPFW